MGLLGTPLVQAHDPRSGCVAVVGDRPLHSAILTGGLFLLFRATAGAAHSTVPLRRLALQIDIAVADESCESCWRDSHGLSGRGQQPACRQLSPFSVLFQVEQP